MTLLPSFKVFYGLPSILYFYDLIKAFDTVAHVSLLELKLVVKHSRERKEKHLKNYPFFAIYFTHRSTTIYNK